MTPLSIAAICMAIPHLAVGLLAVARPGLVATAIKRFPRNRLLGRIITVIDLAWITWLTLSTTLPFPILETNKNAIWLITPILAYAIIRYMHELLAPRAWGGFLLLACNPLLHAAFLQTTSLKLIVTLTCYVWIVLGIVLVVHPFRFRQLCAPASESSIRLRATGLIATIFGAILLGLAIASPSVS